MRESFVRKAGSIGQDNLIAKPFPRAIPFGVKVAAGQGQLKRGAVLVLGEDGSYTVLTEATTGKANCVLADDVDASGEAAVTAVAYRTGHLNIKALIVAEGYTLTQADKEELRKGGILLSEMMD
ncbi:MAG: head decoration protein [Acutalibacter sp.]|nr:head decoration protein [Acutalibacter sp.]